jgi:hypothetical protein
VDAADQARRDAPQRRFERKAPRGVQRFLHAAELRLELHEPARGGEGFFRGVDHELAGGQEVEADGLLRDQAPHQVARQEGQAEQAARGLLRPLGGAGAEERQAPAPLRRVQARAEAQRAVGAEQPAGMFGTTPGPASGAT